MDQQQQDHHHQALDIASLAEELRHELDTVTPSSTAAQLAGGGWPAPCVIVGKVGDLTRNVDPGQYDPHYVSIGPYHRLSNLHLARDTDKVRTLHAVLSAAAVAASGAPVGLEVYLDELARLEDRARSCYFHSFSSMSSKEFVRMLLLDGCYILSRFGDVVGGRRRSRTDGIMPSVADGGGDRLEDVAVVRDVFYLAENQIPFFVVEKIHELLVLDEFTPAVEGIARYARELLRGQQYTVVAPPAPVQPENLLHLLHMHFTPDVVVSATGDPATAGGKTVGRWRTATEYYFAGVKIKSRALRSTKGARCVLDVKVDGSGGALQIPRLNIDGETWRLLRNLVALEQRNTEAAGSHVTAYCVFMSQLACTAYDVDLLSRRGVIVHGLGNNGEVARCFADLCKGVVFDADDAGSNYLRPVNQALERRFRSRPRRWMAWMVKKYFTNPWLTVGLVAAVVGLACTVVQAWYSVLSYKQSANTHA